jgi:hypothetical protein
MAAGDNGEAEKGPQLMVGAETLEEFFHESRRGIRVTREQLLRVIALYAQKLDVQEAMEVLAFGLRGSLRQMIKEEREAQEAESKSGILIVP